MTTSNLEKENAFKNGSVLGETGVEVHPETFSIISISKAEWPRLLADNALSPSGDTPFMVFSDEHEVTLVLGSRDVERIKPALGTARVGSNYRLLTFSLVMDLSVVGFIAAVSGILADAQIPILPLSSFSRDHLLIRQTDLADALRVLSPHVRDLC